MGSCDGAIIELNHEVLNINDHDCCIMLQGGQLVNETKPRSGDSLLDGMVGSLHFIPSSIYSDPKDCHLVPVLVTKLATLQSEKLTFGTDKNTSKM